MRSTCSSCLHPVGLHATSSGTFKHDAARQHEWFKCPQLNRAWFQRDIFLLALFASFLSLWSSSVPEELKGLLADKCIQTELDILSCCDSQELNKYWMHFTSRVDIVSVENMIANVKCVESPFLGEIVHNCKKKPFLSTVCSKQWKWGIDCVLMKFKVFSWSIGYHL